MVVQAGDIKIETEKDLPEIDLSTPPEAPKAPEATEVAGKQSDVAGAVKKAIEGERISADDVETLMTGKGAMAGLQAVMGLLNAKNILTAKAITPALTIYAKTQRKMGRVKPNELKSWNALSAQEQADYILNQHSAKKSTAFALLDPGGTMRSYMGNQIKRVGKTAINTVLSEENQFGSFKDIPLVDLYLYIALGIIPVHSEVLAQEAMRQVSSMITAAKWTSYAAVGATALAGAVAGSSVGPIGTAAGSVAGGAAAAKTVAKGADTLDRMVQPVLTAMPAVRKNMAELA